MAFCTFSNAGSVPLDLIIRLPGDRGSSSAYCLEPGKPLPFIVPRDAGDVVQLWSQSRYSERGCGGEIYTESRAHISGVSSVGHRKITFTTTPITATVMMPSMTEERSS